ncbi:MAG: flagellar hook-associated protein 3, partial [Rhodocyclaceae bacterium]|nr:flagellar hook-associated protein 3 [Rhodocyclaceae bacterium]
MLRTSTEMIFYNGVNSTNMRLLDLLNTSNQLSTGKRILTPADDPIAAARVLETSQSKAVVKQFGDNIGYANDGMALLETKLKGIEDIVQYVRRQTV